MKNKIIAMLIGLFIVALCNSCKKYLETKPSTSYSTITSINDVQQLIYDPAAFCSADLPDYGRLSADEYYFNTDDYNSFKNYTVGQVYIWGKYPFINQSQSYDWGKPYNAIMVCNTVLDALDRITIDGNDKQKANIVRGSALAYRGYFFWKLACIYTKAYDPATAAKDLGIPLRLGIDLDEKLTRGTVQKTYDQIIKDFTSSLPLLPALQENTYKPSKCSVYAMLAEVYLSMRNYNEAGIYANASLQLKNDLINYNDLNSNSAAPIPVDKDNVEVLALLGASAGFFETYMEIGGNIDTLLFKSYKDNDLRKHYFFTKRDNGTYRFSGSYTSLGSGISIFSGPTTAEMYLTRAECLARQGKTAEALSDLNTLLKNRITNTPSIPFVPYTAANANDALQLILQERRKELIFRDLRWMDIKRLNMEDANITLTRNVDGQTYTLPPNDNRFALQLPESVIQLSGMEQNSY